MDSNTSDRPKRSGRPSRTFVLALALMGMIGVLAYLTATRSSLQRRTAEAGPEPAESDTPATAVVPEPARVAPQEAAPAGGMAGWPLEVTPRSREWVARITQPSPPGVPLTPEAAAAWKRHLQELVSLAAEAVPAIRESLATQTETPFDAATRSLLGYDSPRMALIDALFQIAGVEGEEALASVLSSTLDPKEIALIARNLESLAPGRHGIAASEAARNCLAAASAGKLSDLDVAPAFEVLREFGGAAAPPDIEHAATQWPYYAAITLSQMPETGGVESLIRLANAEGGLPRIAADPAIRMLASLSDSHPEAQEAFLRLVAEDRISGSTWTALSPILAGDRMEFTAGMLKGAPSMDPHADVRFGHLNYGNQNFYTWPRNAFTPEDLARQLRWLDQLGARTTRSEAQEAIQQARSILGRRLPSGN